MESYDLQKEFFQQLKGRLPQHLSLPEEVAELLSISTDSSYRRIRGEKPITLEEIQKLCNHFKLSLDQLLSIDTDTTLFYGQWADYRNFNFETYLANMLKQLQHINSFENKIVYFEAKDIPMFHHFQYPALAAFKSFFWMKSILQYPSMAKKTFSSDDIPESIFTIGKQIIDTYNEIPSAEIWSIETINSSIRQIEYYKDGGMFEKKSDITLIYEQLEQLVDHLEKQAENGVKYSINEKQDDRKRNFQLYFNEVILGHNTILAITGDTKTVFLNHGVLNYLTTHDKKFCDYTLESLENIMRKSSLISSVSEKERSKFFNALRKKITSRKNAIN